MAKKTLSKSGKKKNWYTVIAPKVFNEMVVGETMAVDPRSLVGRTVKSSLMTFTRSMKKQNITISLKITDIRDNKAYTEITSYTTNSSAVKRLVRRRRDKVDDSFVCKTKDGKLIRIKPMILTRSNTSNSALTALRHISRYMLITSAMRQTYGEIVDGILNEKFTRDLKRAASYVFPVRMASVRAFELEEDKKVKVTPLTTMDKNVYTVAAEKMAAARKAKDEKIAEARAMTSDSSEKNTSEKTGSENSGTKSSQ